MAGIAGLEKCLDMEISKVSPEYLALRPLCYVACATQVLGPCVVMVYDAYASYAAGCEAYYVLAVSTCSWRYLSPGPLGPP